MSVSGEASTTTQCPRCRRVDEKEKEADRKRNQLICNNIRELVETVNLIDERCQVTEAINRFVKKLNHLISGDLPEIEAQVTTPNDEPTPDPDLYFLEEHTEEYDRDNTIDTNSSLTSSNQPVQCQRNKTPIQRLKSKYQSVKRFNCKWPGCEYRCNYRSGLNSHLKKHTGEKTFLCDWPQCNKSFINLSALTIHLRSHTNERPFKCDKSGCNFAANTYHNLLDHQNHIHSNKRPFPCPRIGCTYAAKAIRALKTHLKSHEKREERYRSDDEEEIKVVENEVKERTKQKQSHQSENTSLSSDEEFIAADFEPNADEDESDKNESYINESSNSNFIRVSRVTSKRRIKTEDKDEDSDYNDSDEETDQIQSENENYRQKNSRRYYYQPKKVIPCQWPGCGKKFVSIERRTAHEVIHQPKQMKEDVAQNDEGRFHCIYSDCPKTFKWKGSLKDHLKIHTQEKPFICDFPGCNYRCGRKTTLKQHKIKHSEEKPLVCEWPGCEFRCKFKGSLVQHQRLHTGEKPYKCTYPGCEWRYTQQSTLNAHVKKKHMDIPPSNKRPFICDWPGCDYRAKTKGSMKIHRVVHITDKPYRCKHPGCDFTAKLDMKLKSHVKQVHSTERPFPCAWPGCDYASKTRWNLKAHQEKVHRIDLTNLTEQPI